MAFFFSVVPERIPAKKSGSLPRTCQRVEIGLLQMFLQKSRLILILHASSLDTDHERIFLSDPCMPMCLNEKQKWKKCPIHDYRFRFAFRGVNYFEISMFLWISLFSDFLSSIIELFDMLKFYQATRFLSDWSNCCGFRLWADFLFLSAYVQNPANNRKSNGKRKRKALLQTEHAKCTTKQTENTHPTSFFEIFG